MSPWQVVLVVYVWMSGLAVVLYGLDKWRARRMKPRISEATLLWTAFLCGWPGALIAMRVFHHKTHKKSFLFVFWFVVALHVLSWAVVLSMRYGGDAHAGS